MKTFVAMIVLAIPTSALADSFSAPTPWEQTINGTGMMRLTVTVDRHAINATNGPVELPHDFGGTFLIGGWGGTEIDVSGSAAVIAPPGVSDVIASAMGYTWLTGPTDVIVLPDVQPAWDYPGVTCTDDLFATVTSVPEPSVFWVCPLAILTLAWAYRGRKL